MKMENLKAQWKKLFLVLFDPWVLVLFSATVGLLLLSGGPLTTLTGPSNFVLLLLITLISVILGGRFAGRWRGLTEEPLVVEKGKTAIRNLKLLFSNLSNLENSIRKHLQNLNGAHEDVVANNYYEDMFDLSLMMIKEELIHSIEDWMDVIPEAKLKLHIEGMRDLKNALKISEQKLQSLRQKLASTKTKAKEELAEKIQVEEKISTILRQKILQTKQLLDDSILSGMSTAVLFGALDGSETGNAASEPALPLIENLDKVQVVDLPNKVNNK